MSENKLSDIIKTSLDGIRDFTEMNTVIGNAINTPSGATVIPVSRVNIGFVNGGVDFGQRKLSASQSFGCGGGTGMSITPMAFLVVGKNAEVSLVNLTEDGGGVSQTLSLIEHAPEIIEKIKNTLS